MKMETHKAIRSQHKTIEETKIIKNDVGLKIYNDVKPKNIQILSHNPYISLACN